MSANIILTHNRRHLRYPVKLDLSSYILKKSDRTHIKCVCKDISRFGLGVVTLSAVQLKENLVLVTKDLEIDLKVVWSKPAQPDKNLIYLGLNVDPEKHDIITCLEDAKLLDSAALKKQESELDLILDVPKLKAITQTLNIPDHNLLRVVGLSKLLATHTAYEATYEGHSMAIILPADIKIQKLQTQDDAFFINKLSVLKKQKTAEGITLWRKVWPIL